MCCKFLKETYHDEILSWTITGNWGLIQMQNVYMMVNPLFWNPCAKHFRFNNYHSLKSSVYFHTVQDINENLIECHH